MKILPIILAGASLVLLPSCVDTHYASDLSPRPIGPRIIEREPVVVERHRYIEERPRVMVDRYPEVHRESTRYYGDPEPSITYRRTTTRTYQGY